MLLVCRLSLVLYSRVKGEHVALSELSMRMFDLVQEWILCRYGCMCTFAVCMELCCSSCDGVCIGYELCMFGRSMHV